MSSLSVSLEDVTDPRLKTMLSALKFATAPDFKMKVREAVGCVFMIFVHGRRIDLAQGTVERRAALEGAMVSCPYWGKLLEPINQVMEVCAELLRLKDTLLAWFRSLERAERRVVLSCCDLAIIASSVISEELQLSTAAVVAADEKKASPQGVWPWMGEGLLLEAFLADVRLALDRVAVFVAESKKLRSELPTSGVAPAPSGDAPAPSGNLLAPESAASSATSAP